MRFLNFPITGLSCMLIAILCNSCGFGGADRNSQPTRKVLHSWHDDGGEGKISIHISLPDQIAEFERGGRNIGWCYVATGKEGRATKPGSYKITEKIVDKYSNRYGWIEDEFGVVVNADAQPTDKVPKGMTYVPAPMPFWMRLTSHGIGMHGGIIPEPGQPASHGCIRMPKEFVPILFDSVEVGTPVEISNEPSRREQMIETMTPLPGPRFEGRQRVIRARPLTSADFENQAS